MDDDGRRGECAACPICSGLATLRQARPEVVEHLAKAGVELLLAARALLETATPDGPARPADQGLRRIDVG